MAFRQASGQTHLNRSIKTKVATTKENLDENPGHFIDCKSIPSKHRKSREKACARISDSISEPRGLVAYLGTRQQSQEEICRMLSSEIRVSWSEAC